MSDFERLLDAMVPGLGQAAETPLGRPTVPESLGLRVEGVLGRGGTGWVYRATDPALGRTVAVKVSRPDGGAGARAAVLREARVTAALQCPGVLPVYRVLSTEESACVVFQIAPEQTLRDLDWGALSPEARWAMLHAILRTLVHAHDAEVAHGDLHPQNVAVGALGAVYVMDWGGASAESGAFSGHPGYAAPERLRGEQPSSASDLYSWALLAWELATGSPLRRVRPGEGLGETIARWRTESLPQRPDGVDPELGELLRSCLHHEVTERPSVQSAEQRLQAVLSGRLERARRLQESQALVSRSRVLLDDYRDLSESLQDEMRVVAVQRTKILDTAGASQKRPLWDAEDRMKALINDQEMAWVQAVEAAFRAWTLAEENHDARGLLADLWWLRFRQLEGGSAAAELEVSLDRVKRFDDGRYTRLLQGSGALSLQCGASDARVRIEGFQIQDRQLVPFLVEERPLPLERYTLEPGSWLLTVTAPGKAPVRYPVTLRRREHHRGVLTLLVPEQIGEDWVHVSAGPFRMGGDPVARQVAWKAGGRGALKTFRAGGDPLAKEAVEACSPTVRSYFIMRHCVRSRDYLAFLNTLDFDEAFRRVPGEAGLYGDFRPYWTCQDTTWHLPEDWNPDWPVVAINIDDVTAYAAWMSGEVGVVCRLPTEEEWEKAARGVDGRAFPWGSSFDPTFAHMRRSQHGVPRLWPVGAYPVDCSVYGVMDMAGGVREWTASTFAEGQIVVRGGSWNDDMDELRCAGRRGLPPHFRSSSVGFRLVREQSIPFLAPEGTTL